MDSETIFRQRSSLLIIDHHTHWLTFAANALQVAGHHVHTLESYEDVLAELEKGQTFNLVILGCANVALGVQLLIAHLLA